MEIVINIPLNYLKTMSNKITEIIIINFFGF